MGENSHRVSDEVDSWSRLVTLIEYHLDTPIRDHQLIVEFWRAGMRDAELREHGRENWARYRAHFLEIVVEGCDAGEFTPTLDPDEVVDLLMATLAGAMVSGALQFPGPMAGLFRNALLQQVAQMLGRA